MLPAFSPVARSRSLIDALAYPCRRKACIAPLSTDSSSYSPESPTRSPFFIACFKIRDKERRGNWAGCHHAACGLRRDAPPPPAPGRTASSCPIRGTGWTGWGVRIHWSGERERLSCGRGSCGRGRTPCTRCTWDCARSRRHWSVHLVPSPGGVAGRVVVEAPDARGDRQLVIGAPVRLSRQATVGLP